MKTPEIESNKNPTAVPFVSEVTYRGMIDGVGERTHDALFDGDDRDSMHLYSLIYGDGNFQALYVRLRRTYFELIDKDSGVKVLTHETMPMAEKTPVHGWGELGYDMLANGDFLQFITTQDKNGNDKVIVTFPKESFQTLRGNRAVDIEHEHLLFHVRYEVTLEIAWHYLPESLDLPID